MQQMRIKQTIAICECGFKWPISSTENKAMLEAMSQCPCGKTAKLTGCKNGIKRRKKNSKSGNEEGT